MTDSVDLGAYRYDGGYFLRPESARHQARGDATYQPGEDGHGRYRHVFSYRRSQPTIKEAALGLLGLARNKVFVASFRIGDTDLLKALYDAAERLRGGVYVISALDERSLRKGLQTEDAETPGADDIRAQNKRFEDMTSRGISVRGHENFHAKFLIVDDKVALVSSANLETSAFTGTRSRDATGETGFIVSDVPEVLRLARYFTRLWQDCTYEMPPGEDHTVQDRAATASPCRVPVAEVGRSPSVIWTYGNELGIRDTIHDIIRRARRNLLLASYSLNGLTDHPDLLLSPLEEAVRAYDLQVSLLVRGRNNHAPTRQGASALAELGVRIHADSLTHAKAVIADESHGALFSANFDADHGLVSGAEVGLRIDRDPALNEAVRHLRHAMTQADLEYTPNPTQRDMDTSLEARWRTAWPFESDIAVSTSDAVWRQFAGAARTGPVLYTTGRDEAVRLYAGAAEWTLSRPDGAGNRTLELAGSSAMESTATVLDTWLSSTRSDTPSPDRRGFCPAMFRRADHLEPG
jgi:phosphatidylserine/phosphatidylglycerophosphate/cardiolipin synthase-like enzyme